MNLSRTNSRFAPAIKKPKALSAAGFTLIELLMVISIIGLLSAVVLTSLRTARLRAEDASVQSERHQVQVAFETYLADNGGYPNPDGTTNPYCIGRSDCLLAGVPVGNDGRVLALAGFDGTDDAQSYANYLAAVFTFPAVTTPTVTINGLQNRGFIYIPCGGSGLCQSGTASILSPTNQNGVQTQEVGTWTLSAYVPNGNGNNGGNNGNGNNNGNNGNGNNGNGTYDYSYDYSSADYSSGDYICHYGTGPLNVVGWYCKIGG